MLGWIGTEEEGLIFFNPQTGSFNHFEHDWTDTHNFFDNTINSIYEDNNNFLWIGTKHGLYGLDLSQIRNRGKPSIEKNPTFFSYSHHPEIPSSLSDNWVVSITEDNNKRLWIATHGGGLNLLGRDNQGFINYSR